MDHGSNRLLVHRMASAMRGPDSQRWRVPLDRAYAKNATFHLCHPFNDLEGVDGFDQGFLQPLSKAFKGLHRRDDILIAGEYDGQEWVSTHGNFVGHFEQEWIGIRPTGRLEYLRFGEFHQIQGGKVVETTLFLDIPQLMIAADQWPITNSPGKDRGYTGFIPGPMTQDGIQLEPQDASQTQISLRMVEQMLRSLATEDQAWRPFWHENMMWYGPAAFGSFVGIENFAGFQVPFEQAFELWSGGASGNGVTRHFCRFADGNYICTAGWPSLMCVRRDHFLGQPSHGETLFMRVCDWWRREGDQLAENWVFVDIPDVLLQMGVDVFEGHHDVPKGPRAHAKK